MAKLVDLMKQPDPKEKARLPWRAFSCTHSSQVMKAHLDLLCDPNLEPQLPLTIQLGGTVPRRSIIEGSETKHCNVWQEKAMTTKLVQARVDASIRDEASLVLERWGLTISDMIRILLTRTAKEGSPPLELVSTSKEHDRWFKEQVRLTLDDAEYVDHAEAQAQFTRQRAALKAKFASH